MLDIGDYLEVELTVENGKSSNGVDTSTYITSLLPAKRNECLAHLLQLAIKDALRQNPLAQDTVKRVTSVVAFFNRSAKFYTKLRQRSSGLNLVAPVEVRWNSLYYCLKRMSRKSAKVCINFTFLTAMAVQSHCYLCPGGYD